MGNNTSLLTTPLPAGQDVRPTGVPSSIAIPPPPTVHPRHLTCTPGNGVLCPNDRFECEFGSDDIWKCHVARDSYPSLNLRDLEFLTSSDSLSDDPDVTATILKGDRISPSPSTTYIDETTGFDPQSWGCINHCGGPDYAEQESSNHTTDSFSRFIRRGLSWFKRSDPTSTSYAELFTITTLVPVVTTSSDPPVVNARDTEDLCPGIADNLDGKGYCTSPVDGASSDMIITGEARPLGERPSIEQIHKAIFGFKRAGSTDYGRTTTTTTTMAASPTENPPDIELNPISPNVVTKSDLPVINARTTVYAIRPATPPTSSVPGTAIATNAAQLNSERDLTSSGIMTGAAKVKAWAHARDVIPSVALRHLSPHDDGNLLVPRDDYDPTGNINHQDGNQGFDSNFDGGYGPPGDCYHWDNCLGKKRNFPYTPRDGGDGSPGDSYLTDCDEFLEEPIRDVYFSASKAKRGMAMGGMNIEEAPACKISKLWNWFTVDACFLASSWHITSKGMFVGSCIGVVALIILLEFVRRAQREYDRSLTGDKSDPSSLEAQIDGQGLEIESSSSTGGKGGFKSTI